jgi:hypothetical protein
MTQEVELPLSSTNDSTNAGYLRPVDGIATPPPQDWEFEDQVNDLVAGISGLPGNKIFPRWQFNPPPIPTQSEDWAAVGVTQVDDSPTLSPFVRHVGRKYDSSGNEIAYDGHDYVQEHECITILISFYGPNASKNSRLFRSGLHVSQNWEEARGRGFALESYGPILAMPELVNGEWYDRRDMELKLNRQVDRIYQVRNILSSQGVLNADAGGEAHQTTWNTENVNG